MVTLRGFIVRSRVHCVTFYLQITMYFTVAMWCTGDHRYEYAICCSVGKLFLSVGHRLSYTRRICLHLAQKERQACLSTPLVHKLPYVCYCCLICIKIGGKFKLLILEFGCHLWLCYVAQHVYHSTQCFRGNLPFFEKALVRLRYIDVTENTSIRSWNDYEDNGESICKE